MKSSLPFCLGTREVLACSIVLVTASCVTDENYDPAAGENAFLQRDAPRYGAGGTLSPSANPGRFRVGEKIPPSEYARERRSTVFLDDRKTRGEPERRGSRRSQTNSEEQPPARVKNRGEEASNKVKPQPAKPEPKKKKVSSEPDPNSAVKAPEVEKPEPKPAPKPSPRPEAVVSDKPIATPVPGRSGMVYSPFDSLKRQVDVEGFPSGAEARCPYTQKIFRVP